MKTSAIKPLNPRNPDTKYVGEEPAWRVQPTDNRFAAMSRAFNWYNYFYGKKEGKDMIAAYLDRHNRSREAKKIRALPDSKIVCTTAWLCRMTDMGLELTEQEQIKLDNMVASLLSLNEEPKALTKVNSNDAPRITIQDRLRERVVECAAELDGMFDDFITAGTKLSADFKPVSLMRSMNIAPQLISVIKDIWTKQQQNFELVIQGKDSALVEGYSNFSKVQLKNCLKFCEMVLDDCNSYVQIKKVERKPRKAKPVTPEKRASKFKVIQEFAELKLKGLPAAQLVEKSEAWLYDTKKRKLIHLVADEYAKAFSVKNNSVIGYSAKDTVQKTLRKPAEQLKEITGGGKPAARKAFKDIKATETSWNGRGSDNLIILKSW